MALAMVCVTYQNLWEQQDSVTIQDLLSRTSACFEVSPDESEPLYRLH